MNLSNKNIKKWKYPALAFAFPFVGMLMVMLVSQYEPFGKYSMLYSDMYHQYYPFFVAFRSTLRSGGSLLHSWNVGLGMDYLGLIAYYLASPLNLLSVLVPEALLLEFFSLLVPLKLGLAGLFFAVFLSEVYQEKGLSASLFGTCYALCAWALGYQWNIMWLDTFALLPLVVLGMVKLLRDRRKLLYTLTLFLAVLSNYYVGLFVCIFIFLLFFVYEICRWQGFKRFFLDLGTIALYSLLAIGMTAILELPAFAALQTTQSSVNQFPQGFKMNIASENTVPGLLDAMRQVAGNMAGGISPTFKEGLPNVYCGVGTMMLAWLYLMARDVKLRDKICAVVLLVFFSLSFILRQLDYIWHGFHFTNMIPYRFSFLYSFVLLCMAYQAWIRRRSFRWWQVVVSALITLSIICCANQTGQMKLSGSDSGDSWMFLVFNGIFLLAYLVALLVQSRRERISQDMEEQEIAKAKKRCIKRWEHVKIAVCVIIAAEMILNLVCFGINFTGTSVSGYPKGTNHAASMIRYMKQREANTLFFRAETTHSQTLNDGALNGYNGVSTFTSSANVKVTEFMQALGYGAKNTYNRYCYEEASPVTNLFLNLKYMIERDGRDRGSTWFHELHRYGNVALLQNKAYLPLGFLTEAELADLEFPIDGNGFRFQNVLMQTAAGFDGEVWKLIDGQNMTVTGVDVIIKEQSPSGYCSYENGKKGGTIIYSYEITTDGFMCVDLNFPKRNNVSVWKNGTELYSESISLPQMLAVDDVVVGDTVEIRATCKTASESGTLTVNAAILSEEAFQSCYDVLAASTLELTEFSGTRVAGTIDCDREGLLYTSIPQNGNWFAEVDGEPAEVLTVGEAMVAVKLSEGSHEVVFTYRNGAFRLGWMVSLGSALVFVVLLYLDRQRRKSSGRYAK